MNYGKFKLGENESFWGIEISSQILCNGTRLSKLDRIKRLGMSIVESIRSHTETPNRINIYQEDAIKIQDDQ